MNTSRDNLPQPNCDIFLTDGGIETTLIFHNGFDLPYFASFDLLKTQLGRVQGIRANASRQSHAELDEAEELDPGNPEELGQQYRQLREQFPQFNVLGGCCGTDHRHLEQICHHCVA